MLGLVTTDGISQEKTQKDKTKDKIIVKGTITGKTTQGRIDTLGFATVLLKDSQTGAIADEDGNFKLDLTKSFETVGEPILVFSMFGYDTFEVKLDTVPKVEMNMDVQLTEKPVDIIIFYIPSPTPRQRILSFFRRWFGRW